MLGGNEGSFVLAWLRRFARFVGRVPRDVRVRGAVRLLVKRVTVWKDKIEVETYETAAKDLQNAINGGGSAGGKFKSGRSQAARAKNHRCPRPEANGSGTAVAELRLNWRGRWEQNPTGSEAAPVPAPKIAYLFPAFSLTWPLAWAKITNGERVMEDLAGFPEVILPVPAEALGPESSNPVVLGVDGIKIPPGRPIRAAIAYAQP